MSNVLNIILQNPYRILGVYANSHRKDIVANIGKATAFLKVNLPVEYPLDLKGILPTLTRTLDSIKEADGHLAIAKEQIKYAQFWFLNMTQIDGVAFNHLLGGDVEGAKMLWGKQESLSSLQNMLLCYLIENKLWLGVQVAEKLYDKFGDEYINKIDAHSTLQMTGIELLHQFLDLLSEEVGVQKLLGFVIGGDAKKYIKNHAIGPLINKISSEVERAKKINHKDPKARIEAARRLVSNTKDAFSQLKNILPATDSQYQMIADKLGLEILQCGIDYFNNSEDDDAPHTAMTMQKYAQSVVVGTLAIQRCNENVGILQKIIDNLPPKEVIAEDKAIKAELSKFVHLPDKISYAVFLLNNTNPYLQSIKQKLGANNTFYLKLSTQIVGNALHNIIEEVNAVQQGNIVELDNGHTIDLDILMTPNDKRAKYNRIKSTIKEAWSATIIMDGFDMELDFKSRYNENRNTLKSMCNQMGISTHDSRPSTLSRFVSRPATQAKPSSVYEGEYGNASTGESLWEYIKSHNSSKWQAAFIVTIIGGITGFLIYYNDPYIPYILYDVDEMFKCIAWGTGIGAISWFCILVDDDNKSDNLGDLAERAGCYGPILFLGLSLFYWIYKIIRLVIDGIKGA